MLELDPPTVQVLDPLLAADQATASPGHCLVVAVLELDPSHPLLQRYDVMSCLWSKPAVPAAVMTASMGPARCDGSNCYESHGTGDTTAQI